MDLRDIIHPFTIGFRSSHTFYDFSYNITFPVTFPVYFYYFYNLRKALHLFFSQLEIFSSLMYVLSLIYVFCTSYTLICAICRYIVLVFLVYITKTREKLYRPTADRCVLKMINEYLSDPD